MKQKNKTQQPRVRWGWLLAWAIIHPLAAMPLVLMVLKRWPFEPPFIANGPVVMPALMLAVAPVIMLLHGSRFLEPIPRNTSEE